MQPSLLFKSRSFPSGRESCPAQPSVNVRGTLNHWTPSYLLRTYLVGTVLRILRMVSRFCRSNFPDPLRQILLKSALLRLLRSRELHHSALFRSTPRT